MVTPLITTFITNEKIVVQPNNIQIGSMVESLFIEFDQKNITFLSSSFSSLRSVQR